MHSMLTAGAGINAQGIFLRTKNTFYESIKFCSFYSHSFKSLKAIDQLVSLLSNQPEEVRRVTIN